MQRVHEVIAAVEPHDSIERYTGKDRILGVTLVVEHAGDLLAEFVLAMKQGLGMNKILSPIHAYPTWAEAIKYVAGEWKRNYGPQKLLVWLEKFHAWRR